MPTAHSAHVHSSWEAANVLNATEGTFHSWKRTFFRDSLAIHFNLISHFPHQLPSQNIPLGTKTSGYHRLTNPKVWSDFGRNTHDKHWLCFRWGMNPAPYTYSSFRPTQKGTSYCYISDDLKEHKCCQIHGCINMTCRKPKLETCQKTQLTSHFIHSKAHAFHSHSSK